VIGKVCMHRFITQKLQILLILSDFLCYSIDTKIPLTQTLSHKGRGRFPSLDFVVSSVERWEGLREGEILSSSFAHECLLFINLFSPFLIMSGTYFQEDGFSQVFTTPFNPYFFKGDLVAA